ncbi:oligosaccharide flippase family protein [Massilia sp. S19_KUP03_FR1]|uniref:oligosaccharide flippase family protein n=1 Tax=Massilia sp. S19_KUP03_FR1 TaxID=3025503 RepID=UPI002FCD3A61
MKLQLVRNACANLLGAAIPAAVALVTVPLIVRGLGDAGYGVYALITAIVGYFAIIDINVTAGSVKHIAAHWAHSAHRQEAQQREANEGIAQTITFGLLVYSALGALGGLAVWISAPWLVREVFSVPPTLTASATAALALAAPGFLVGQLQSYLGSVPQSLLRYDSSARLDVLFGSVVPVATVLVLMLGGGLVEIILLRLVASSVHSVLLWRTITRLLPTLRLRWPAQALRRSLLHFSAYACLNRFAAMSYAYADKLMIGALVGVAGLAVYAVASTLANRLLGLTGRLASVLFPAASALAASNELPRLVHIYLKASRFLTYINGAMLLMVAVFAEPILHYWMSADFARRGATVLALMALSQFIDALTALPSLVNDGMGHPGVTGGFALARALLGLVTVYLGVLLAGIDGAAWGHLAASTLMTTLFLRYVHGRTVPVKLRAVVSGAYLPCALGLLGIALLSTLAQAAAAGHPGAVLCIGLITCTALALYGAFVIAAPGDRDRIRSMLQAKFARGT